jgi:hypothetical protein
MPNYAASTVRSRVDAMIEMVSAEARRPSDRARFVYAHLPVPHSPFVYGPNGEPRDPAPGLHHYLSGPAAHRTVDRAAYLSDYRDQLTFVNTRILRLVDSILAGSTRRPVVVLVSDHGSRSGFDFSVIDAASVDESTANLVAVRSPGHRRLLGDEQTLVNVLGPVLDAYLGTHHPPQRDAIYLETGGWFSEAPRPAEPAG